jgi:ribonucleoside-diphosphate reductase alpha chain
MAKEFKNNFSEEIWKQTYKHHTDNNVKQTWKRVGENLASVEKDEDKYKKEFYDLLEDFKFVPGGRILSNAGTEWKASYINCFVNPRDKYDIDSLNGIFQVLTDQANTLKAEGGWGCNFSFIRPRGSFIGGIGVESPGAVKFMELFDKSSEIITSGSGKESKNKKGKGKIRKGAMMGILSCLHPDIEEFISAKQSEGRLSKFNISVGCSNAFMDKVIECQSYVDEGKEIPEEVDRWDLVFPDTDHEKYKEDWFGDFDDWISKGYPVITHKTIKASELWDKIMQSTYNRNDPGVVFLDIANKTHGWNYGPSKVSKILATNPCGEQSLPSAGCCNLGSVNLTQFIDEANNTFDFDKIKKAIRTAVRFLDNVNSKSYVPLKEYQDTMEKLRRIGIGVMGWGSSLYLLKIRYGSEEAEALKEELMKAITYTAIDESINLAIEKGPFEYCEIDKHWKGEYFKQINLPEEILEKMKKHGIRNSSLFSIQPTGNTGILANNISGGLEPIFLYEYIRTVICPTVPKHIEDKCPRYWEGEFKETEMFKHRKEGSDDIWVGKDENGVVYKIDRNRGLTKEELCEDYAVKILKEKGEWDVSANWAVTTTELSAKEHIIDMKGFSKYIDSSVSKTINLPADYPYDDFKNIYLDCYKTGYIKGFTTYRAGTMTSVLKSSNTDSEDEFIHISTNTAPKRPKTLDADIYAVTARGDKFVIVVGKLGEQPYEVFGGHSNGFNIKKSTNGTITKIKRGQYALSFGDIEIDDFSEHFTPQEQTIFRMASTMLRHGVPIEFICEQMQKSTDDMFSLPSAISRVLKKYIKEGQEVLGFECPQCDAGDVYYQEGCKTCKSCGWSMCG